MNFTANVQNFPATAVVNIAHIHTGADGSERSDSRQHHDQSRRSGADGGSGTFTRVASAGDGDAATTQSILDNPAGFYFNVHTAANPGGVMRGQLVKQ